jgi:Holliday junction resolvase-like predicted endonuclease
LKLTKNGPGLIENVKDDAKIPLAATLKLLEKLQNEELIYLKVNLIEANSSRRLKLAVKAALLGADIEQLSNFLCWQEFEEIVAFALQSNGFSIQNNVRFKHAGRRWEIDVVGSKKPIVVCVDCKHWQRAISSSTLHRIVDKQVERTKAFAGSLPNVAMKINCTQWERAKFVPVVLSLIPSSQKFFNKVPIVPVLQIQDFINQFAIYIETLKFFPKTFNKLTQDF